MCRRKVQQPEALRGRLYREHRAGSSSICLLPCDKPLWKQQREKQCERLHYIHITGPPVLTQTTGGPAWFHACFPPKDPVMDAYIWWATLPTTNEKDVDSPAVRTNKHSEHVLWPSFHLLFTVPFTASPTNAMEMNKAMTSSVELRGNGNTCKGAKKRSVIAHIFSKT